MLFQEQSIKSLDLSELDFETTSEKKQDEDDIELEEEVSPGEGEEVEEVEEVEDQTKLTQKIDLAQSTKKQIGRFEEKKTFDKFLDLMEVF